VTDSLFLSLLKREGIPLPVSEYRFNPDRKWRFDFAFVQHLVAIEVEGGVFTRGRHMRGAGALKDMEKYNCAASMGWRLLRVTPKQLCDLQTIALIRETLNYKRAA
jgi:very-short-patch-repair endonuclease